MARKAITADEIRQTVKDENVLFLRLMFTDINGIIKKRRGADFTIGKGAQ